MHNNFYLFILLLVLFCTPVQNLLARVDLFSTYCGDISSVSIDKLDLTFSKIDRRRYDLVIDQQDSTFNLTASALYRHPSLTFSTSYTEDSETTTVTAALIVSTDRRRIVGDLTVTTGSGSPSTIAFSARRGACPASATSALPDISTFSGSGLSDRFIVDTTYMAKGFPFKGTRARSSHQGGHVHVTNPASGSGYTWPDGSGKYLPIYAVADGIVARVDEYFAVDANYRYGISLRFALKDGSAVSFEYSIEPMINPGDSTFYQPYINTTLGSTVTKGDILAYFYIPDGGTGDSHIHFHLSKDGSDYAASIFNSTIVQDFHDHFGEFGLDQTDASDPGVEIGVCMGYMLGADENIFGTGDVDCQ